MSRNQSPQRDPVRLWRLAGWLLVPQITWLLAVGSAAASGSPGDSQAFEFGTKRRVVMSQLRMAGLEVRDSSGSHLLFAGGPGIWSDATSSEFRFEGLKLRSIEYIYEGAKADARTCQRYHDLWNRLKDGYGYPWDQSQSLSDSCVDGKPARTLRASWTDFDVKAELVRERTKERFRITIQSERDVASDDYEAQRAETGGAIKVHNRYATAARLATESLLDEFSDKQFVIDAAKRRDAPLNVRLERVKITSGIKGVDKTIIERRLRTLVRGDWNLELTLARSVADLNLRVAIVPALKDRQRVYAMTLEVRQARGRDRGKVLFSGARILDTDFVSSI